MERDAARSVRTILIMVVLVAVPVFLTHATIEVPQWARDTVANPTPRGYTMSLLLFAFPVAVIAVWHWMHGGAYDRRAFWMCAALMTALGFVLDILFGYHFFAFPNEAATLGIRLPAWNWGEMGFVPDYLPVEEFGFYILGAIYMMSVYLWADARWLSAYDPDRYEKAPELPRIIQVSPHAAALWVALLAYGVGHRYLVSDTFPAYYLFLMGAGVLPSLFLVRATKRFVNWQALGFTFGALVLISVIWEASFAVPYGWWVYKDTAMLGIYLPAWGNLPIEAVILWLVGVWDAVMFYELFRVRNRMEDRKMRHALFGRPGGAG